ncbi:MAG: GTPase HflX [Clostridia bacterium]|nr:GTPase HflX [Clostridia bacterium]
METNNKIDTERAAVVGIITYDNPENEVNASLDELERLLETAGGKALVRLVQAKESPDVRTFLGSGKIKELAELCYSNEITLVVCDSELSPSQIRNMEDALDNGNPEKSIRVIDRSMLILDIFALHATSSEGKLQVELAQLKYTAPRLIGKGISMSRQQGGNIAMRGPGETKLESDRRHIKRRMHALEEELAAVEQRRATQRKQRDRSGICRAAIVGYTNAGKSTLLNRLTDAGILAEDKLFATLDPTTRKFTLPEGTEVLLVDTVGFIRNLPHHLIKAFRSTLDEAAYADIVIMMTDASDPEASAQLEVTEKLISELGAGGKPTLCLFNKCDLDAENIPYAPRTIPTENVFYISARTGRNIDDFVKRLEELVNENTSHVTFKFPLDKQDSVARLYRFAKVENVEYFENCVKVEAVCDGKAKGMFREWILKKDGEADEKL